MRSEFPEGPLGEASSRGCAVAAGTGRPSCQARFVALALTHGPWTAEHLKGDPRAEAQEAELVSLMLGGMR